MCSLDHVNLEIADRDRIAIIGPSGGGKTTLLRALEGSLGSAGGNVERFSTVALVYQDLRLVAERSILDNVCSGAFGELKGFSGVFRFPEAVKQRATGLLQELGLAQLADRRVGSLSGGQRQRVAIARALISRPGVLLADEPLAALDRPNARRTVNLLERLQEKYNFSLCVSIHDPTLAPNFFNRFLAVDDGKVEELESQLFASEQDFRQYEFAGSSRPRASLNARPARRDTGFLEPEGIWERGAVHQPEESSGLAVPTLQDRAITGASPRLAIAWKTAAVLGLAGAVAWSATQIDLKGAAFSGAFKGGADFLKGVAPNSWSEFTSLPWKTLSTSLLQTVQMALLGTVMGIIPSLPLAIMASRQTGPAGVRWIVRFLLNGVRTIPSIFWALLFVAFVGLGPVSGVFALACYSSGYLTKFFYEALEDADGRPATALEALGASRLQTFLWAVLPAARPTLVGACLFMFEYNIRGGSVLGVVGAGGIGQDLMYYIEWRQFPSAAAGLLMILAVVVALDAISHWWRRRLTRQRGV